MLHTSELRGLSRDERQAVLAAYQKSVDALDIFERKLDAVLLDPRLSAGSRKFIKHLWYGQSAAMQMALCNRSVWDAHTKALIISHIEFCRHNPSFMNGGTRARLITLSPNAGLMPIAALSTPLVQLKGFADRAARLVNTNALFTLDAALFCPKRGMPVHMMAAHVHGTLFADNQKFKSEKAAKAIGATGGVVNTMGGRVADITTRGWKNGEVLELADVAGLGWYSSKLSCGVNTCFMAKSGQKSENSQTDWKPIDALRQLEFWSHFNALETCWGVGEGRVLRKLWRDRLMTLIDATLSSREAIPLSRPQNGSKFGANCRLATLP